MDMQQDTKLVIEILAPIIIMMGWMWKNLSNKIDKVDLKLDTKIDKVDLKLDTKIDSLALKLDTKIDNVALKLGNKIESLELKLENKIDENIKEIRVVDRRLQKIEDRLE